MKPRTRTGLTLCGCVVLLLIFAGRSPISRADESKGEKRAPIYDEKTDGEKLLQRALAKAKKEDKHVLIMWGGNWCGWCYKLTDVFEKDPEVSKRIASWFVVLHMDSRKESRHIAERFKADINGYPYLTMLDRDGKLLTHQRTDPFEEGRVHDPKRVLAWLERWQPKPHGS